MQSQNATHEILKEKVITLIENENNEEALKLAIEELNSSEKNNNLKTQIYWCNTISDILRNNHDFERALNYLKKAEKIGLKTKDSLLIANNIFKIGSLYTYEYSEASYNSGKASTKTNIRKLAFKRFEYLLDSFRNTKGIEKIIANTYANLTGLYSITSEYNKAERASENAIKYFKKSQDTLSVIGVQTNLGVLYLYKKEYNKAEKVFLDAQPFLKDTNNLKILDYKTINLNNLSLVYEKKGDHIKALEYLDKSLILKNIIDTKKHNLEIIKIEEKYSQEKALSIEKEKSKTLKIWLVFFIIFTLFIIVFGFFRYKNNKLKSRNLALKLIKKELERTNELEKIENENQNKILNATLDAREKERKYISEVLHDSVSSLLSSANMHLQVVKKKTGNTIEELDKSSNIIKEASEKIRDLSHKLTSSILLKFGLTTAILDLCEKYTNSFLTFELENEEPIPRFNEDFEIKIHNIIEELTNNIIKHSQASQAKINLKHINNQLFIEVKDDGKGFNTKKIELQNGLGLSLIKARVKILNGTIKIESSDKKGTVINISVPTKINNKAN